MTLFGGYSYDCVSAGIWVIHTGPKSGGEQVTLIGGYSYDGLNAAIIGVQHTEVSNLGVMLFEGYSYHGLNAIIGVQHTEVPNLGASWSCFLTVTIMMV